MLPWLWCGRVLGRSNWAACFFSSNEDTDIDTDMLSTYKLDEGAMVTGLFQCGQWPSVYTTPSLKDSFKFPQGNSCSLRLQAPSVALSCPAQHVKSEVLRTHTTTNDKRKHVIGQTRPRHSPATAIRDTDLRRLGPRLASTGRAGKQFVRYKGHRFEHPHIPTKCYEMLDVRWIQKDICGTFERPRWCCGEGAAGWYVSPSGTDLAMRCCMKARLHRTDHVYCTAPRVQHTGGVCSTHTRTHM